MSVLLLGLFTMVACDEKPVTDQEQLVTNEENADDGKCLAASLTRNRSQRQDSLKIKLQRIKGKTIGLHT